LTLVTLRNLSGYGADCRVKDCDPMKATCPSCSTSYKVAETKVPDSGAQIKCPKCGVLFVVRRKADAPLPPPPQPKPDAPAATQDEDLFPQVDQAFDSISEGSQSAHSQSTPLEALTGEPAPAPIYPGGQQPDPAAQPAPSATPGLDALDGESFVSVASSAVVKGDDSKSPVSDKVARARGVSAIRAQSGAKAKTGLLESYRVRTSRGLTYDFSTREAMTRWLSEREDLVGYEAAEPGGNWIPAESLMKLKEGKPSKTAEIIARSPGDPVAESIPPAPMATAARGQLGKARPMGEQAGGLLWILSILTMLGMFLVLAASLTRYGVVDLSIYLPLESVGITFPEVSSDDPAEDLPDLKKQDSEKVFRKALSAGKRSIRMRRFSKAALEYNRALSIHQGSVEALEGLARAYKGLGDLDRAAAAMKKARSIKGK